MTIEEFKVLVETYGANVAHWPEAVRADAKAFSEASAEAHRLLDAEAALDRLLDAADTAPATRALEDRILTAFPDRPRTSGGARRLFTFAPPRWTRAAALAASLLLGLAAGAELPALAGVGDEASADPAIVALLGGDGEAWSDLEDGI
jgi:hypothetical protein